MFFPKSDSTDRLPECLGILPCVANPGNPNEWCWDQDIPSAAVLASGPWLVDPEIRKASRLLGGRLPQHHRPIFSNSDPTVAPQDSIFSCDLCSVRPYHDAAVRSSKVISPIWIGPWISGRISLRHRLRQQRMNFSTHEHTEME